MDNVFYEREEEISENPQSVRIVIDNTLEGKELEVHTGTENGYKRFCDEYKICYDLRQHLIKLLD